MVKSLRKNSKSSFGKKRMTGGASLDAAPDVNTKMQAAKRKWRNLAIKYDLPTSPAYDVVCGVASILNNPSDYFETLNEFQITGLERNKMIEPRQNRLKNWSQVPGNELKREIDDLLKYISLEEDYSSTLYFFKEDMFDIAKKNMSPVLSHLAAEEVEGIRSERDDELRPPPAAAAAPVEDPKKIHFIIFTDLGEETDDEATCLFFAKLADKYPGKIKVSIVFTAPQYSYENESEKLSIWIKQLLVKIPTNVNFIPLQQLTPEILVSGETNRILQIAPLYATDELTLANANLKAANDNLKKVKQTEGDMPAAERRVQVADGEVQAAKSEQNKTPLFKFLEKLKDEYQNNSYYLLGEIGKTHNSKAGKLSGEDKDAVMAPYHFIASCKNSYNVCLQGGKRLFQFTCSGLNSLFDPEEETNTNPTEAARISKELAKKANVDVFNIKGQTPKHNIIEHAINIGFRNLVGRAHPKVGQFVTQLVASDPPGANYSTIMNIYSILNDFLYTKTGMLNHLLPEDKLKALDTIKNYISYLIIGAKGFFKMKLDPQGKTNARGAPHIRSVIEGYYEILCRCYELLGVPIQFWLSGAPGEWEPEWLGKKVFSDTQNLEISRYISDERPEITGEESGYIETLERLIEEKRLITEQESLNIERTKDKLHRSLSAPPRMGGKRTNKKIRKNKKLSLRKMKGGSKKANQKKLKLRKSRKA